MTGIVVLDNLLKLAGNIFLVWLFIIAMARIVKMFHRHEYAQLVATVIFFLVAFLFVNAPGTVKEIATSFIGLFTNLK